MKVLSVDDSRAIQAFLVDCLKDTKVDLVTVGSGKECLDLLGSQPFDLVLLDWEMPGMLGTDVLKELRERGIEMPVYMLTSKNNSSNLQEAVSLGASDYIMKPFTRELLLEKMEVFFGQSVL